MRWSLFCLALWLPVASSALACQVEVSWRWPGIVVSGQYNEMLIRAVPHGDRLSTASAITRIVLEEHLPPSGTLNVDVEVQKRLGWRNWWLPETRLQSRLKLDGDGRGSLSVPLFVPKIWSRVQVALLTADGKRYATPDGAFEHQRDHVSSEPRSLHVMWRRPDLMTARQYSRIDYRCTPREFPATETALAPLKRIVLWDHSLEDLSRPGFEALVAWVQRGGLLTLTRESRDLSEDSERLEVIGAGPALAARAVDHSGSFLPEQLGLGRILVGAAPTGRELMGRILTHSEAGLPDDLRVGSRNEAGPVWSPAGSSYRDRRGAYYLMLIPYALALAVLGVLLHLKRSDTLIRLIPVVGLVFCGLYALVAAWMPSELQIRELRILQGDSWRPRASAVLFSSVFSPTARTVELTSREGGIHPPAEYMADKSFYRRNKEVRGPLDVRSANGGWSVRLGLLPAQARTLFRPLEAVTIGRIGGGLTYDSSQESWAGTLTSHLALPLRDAHLVHGWRHQRLGALRPGQSVAVTLPAGAKDTDSRYRSYRHSNGDGNIPCASCGRSHPISGAIWNLLADRDPESRFLMGLLVSRASRHPEFFTAPLLIGFTDSRVQNGSSESRSDRTVVVIRLPKNQLSGPVKMTADLADWDVNFSTYPQRYNPELMTSNCNPPGSFTYRTTLNLSNAMRFKFPYTGPVRSIRIQGWPHLKTGQLQIWNLATDAYDDIPVRAGKPVVIDENTDAYFDRGNGSLIFKVIGTGQSSDWPEVEIEGGEDL